jgi:hypothetical protein
VAGVVFRLADDADDAGTAPGGDLGGGLTDFAVEAHDENGFARLGLASAAEAFLGCDKRHADAGSFVDGHGNRFFNASCGFDDQERGVCAVAADAEIAGGAEHFFANKVGGTFDHEAGEVAAGGAGEHGIGHHADGSFDIGWVDGGGFDFNQHLRIRRACERVRLYRRDDAGGVSGFGVQADGAGGVRQHTGEGCPG